MKRQSYKYQRGFTILELVISLSVGLIVLAALSSTFFIQRKTFDNQEQITTMVQTGRAAIDMMSREIQSGGYDPTGMLQRNTYPIEDGKAFVGVPYDDANPTYLRILSDFDGDEATTGENEEIIYRFNSSDKKIERNTGGGFQPFAENIENFTFTLLREDGSTPVTTQADSKYVRIVRLTITARSEDIDPNFAANGGYRTTTLISDVKVRNMGLDKIADDGSGTTTSATGGTTSTSTVPPTTTTTTAALNVTEILQVTSTTTEPGITTTTFVGDIQDTVTLHIAVGTCAVKDGKINRVLARLRITDYVTSEPISNATVTWKVVDTGTDIGDEQGPMTNFGSIRPDLSSYQGWYGGYESCNCSDEAGLSCAISKPEFSYPLFRKVDVVVTINLPGYGNVTMRINDNEIIEVEG